MTVNLHTHTFRCGHATGTEREYIERAIAGGITHMGFSDHSPFIFPDGRQSRYRVPMERAQEYVDTLRALREEYKDRIKIYIGFEMEYYPLHFEQMLRTVSDLGAEYLIMGLHALGSEEKGHLATARATTDGEHLTEYVDTVIKAIESGVFTYIAHPDIFNFFGDEELYNTQMRRICKSAVQCDVPLELNFLGIRSGRYYPRQRFWRIAAEEGCKTVFGCDAHTAKDAYDESSLAIAKYLQQAYGLRVETRPQLVDPKTGNRYNL